MLFTTNLLGERSLVTVPFTYRNMCCDLSGRWHMEPNQIGEGRGNFNRGRIHTGPNNDNLGEKNMKRFIFILLVACVAFIGCEAKEAEARGGGDPCKSFLGNILNDCVGHPTKKDKMEVGIGADIKLWDHEKFIIDQETKVDMNAGDDWGFDRADVGTYTVIKPKMEKGLFQIVGDWVSGLFNRGE